MLRRVARAAGVLALLVVAAAGADTSGPIVVIVSPQYAGERIGLDDLALIYERKRLYWTDGHRMQPVNLAAQEPLRVEFSRAVLGAEPAALDSYWNEQYFRGVRPPYVVASPEAMLRFVAETPGAIGYVDACHYSGAAAPIGFIDADGHWHRARTPPACAPAP